MLPSQVSITAYPCIQRAGTAHHFTSHVVGKHIITVGLLSGVFKGEGDLANDAADLIGRARLERQNS